MALISLAGVPDVEPKIEAGVHLVQVIDAPKDQDKPVTEKSPETGRQLLFRLKVVGQEDKDKDKEFWHNITYTDPRQRVGLNRMAKSCKVPFDSDGQIDPDLFAGKVGCVVVKQSVVTDKTTGLSTTYVNAKDFLIPGEPGYRELAPA